MDADCHNGLMTQHFLQLCDEVGGVGTVHTVLSGEVLDEDMALVGCEEVDVCGVLGFRDGVAVDSVDGLESVGLVNVGAGG